MYEKTQPECIKLLLLLQTVTLQDKLFVWVVIFTSEHVGKHEKSVFRAFKIGEEILKIC